MTKFPTEPSKELVRSKTKIKTIHIQTNLGLREVSVKWLYCFASSNGIDSCTFVLHKTEYGNWNITELSTGLSIIPIPEKTIHEAEVSLEKILASMSHDQLYERIRYQQQKRIVNI